MAGKRRARPPPTGRRGNGSGGGAGADRAARPAPPPLYTAGTSADPADLIDARFPVHRTGRGGQFTYHGPGQRVVYVMLDLRRRKPDIRCYVASLEEWLI